MKKQWALILLTAILLSLSADRSNAAQKRNRATSASRKARALELRGVEQFKDVFQSDEGKVRLLALVSPT